MQAIETEKYTPQSNEWKRHSRVCAEYVALDLVPLSTVEQTGLRTILSNDNERINSISRGIVSREIKLLEKEVDDEIFTILKESSVMVTSTAVWTSGAGEEFA